MAKRILTVTAASATVALALSACASGGTTGDAATNRGPITIWYSNNETEIAWGKQMVEAWNAENPDEKVKAQEIPAGKSSEEVIGAAITAGNAPCLVFNTAPVAVPQFEKQGGLVDLSSFEDGAAYIEARSGDTAEQYQGADAKYFQMPWKSNPVMIFYNKDMFTAAGLDAENPQLATYDEFLATSRTLVESGAAPNAIYPAPTSQFFQSWFDFYPLYAAETGGTQLIEDGEATFNDEDGAKVAEFWKTLYAEGLAGKEQYQGDSFADGQAAMSIVGPWAVSVYKDAVNWGAVPVPTSEGTPAEETYTFSDAKNVGMFTACENQATAWDVLKFATSEDQDGQLLELTGQMPLREDLPTVYPEYFAANPAYEQFGDQASRMVEVPNVSSSVAAWQAFRDAYTKSVITGEGEIPAALDSAAEKIKTLISKP
ncbi:extracellular solute-binding protein [Cryobacterium sp. TMT1-62]|uniref:Extracellular solute-binding protein n=1 Tax=Cryobacterium sandaracinum TaxID=1259247 RepID=A0ABY2JFH1_9MICO|nr:MULTISPECIES: extracellular solute-binding protein [Cryobacterium]TFB59609.1 extracellular solute-binding protein [Cryobacterium sp. Hz7]TFB60646.1 extracellular solute-binding protein [Cryobacterium sp. Sr3]TFC39130.1 extracellular solute-binding protein [Cryobacterium sp. TMT2-14]TFC70666.1 extracellular solute-binding protein [Cryobacterium sp. TMT2-4]TFD04511.1 extracellular solute-binding protein [Cryobacterium sandaracinum]